MKNPGYISRVDILLNKDRYIEFGVSTSTQFGNYLRLLFGTKIERSGNYFHGSKSVLPHVKRVLELKGFEVRVTEDWI